MSEINLNLADLAGGAAQERFMKAWEEVQNNVLDPNTDPKKARALTIKISVKPNENRDLVDTIVDVKTTLAPAVGVGTTILLGRNADTGQLVANELHSGVKGQIYIDPTDEFKVKTDIGQPIEEVEKQQQSSGIIDLQQHQKA